MQTSSLLCASALTPSHHSLASPLRIQPSRLVFPSSPLQFPFKHLQNDLHAIFPLHSTATQEIVETAKSESGLVEVGYLSSVHGLHGEICVKPSTDFPELRFSKPGRRWLRQPVFGKERVQEVELVEGRGHHGQKSWILKFGGVDTVDQAKQLVGSTMLVKEDDRPELDKGEFYSRDLVGMRVILKETGELLGTVVNVFNSGASDLLHVMLYRSVDVPNGTEKSNTPETGASGPLVWIPFVEAIVPDVDMHKREMLITPPKGLLELNICTDEMTKKERRKLEWKERKRFQRRLIAAKKKLCELEQKHVFDGLRYGEKSRRSLLAEEIVGVNSKLLQLALQNLEIDSKRWSVSEIINATRTNLVSSSLNAFKGCLAISANEENVGVNFNLQKKGLHLLSKGKVAFVLVVNDIEKKERCNNPDMADTTSTTNSLFSSLENSLSDDDTFVKVEDRASVPLVLVCPEQEIQSLKCVFSDNDYFGFDANKVWFLEEEKLPVIGSSVEENKRNKILMKSPWEVLQSPVGSGGVISLLSSNNIPDSLGEIGVEYIQICSTSQKYVTGNSILLGYVNSLGAEIGIQIQEGMENVEESFGLIFSMDVMKKLTRRIDKLQFYLVPKSYSHVEMVDKEWIDVVPSSPNSYELHCSIYSSLNACSLEKICVMKVTE